MPDVYQIAMELNLDDKASEGLRSITDGLTKLVEQLDLAKKGFDALHFAVLGSAGAGIVLGMMKISGAANELTRNLNQMRMAGMDTERAMAAVNATVAARPGTTYAEDLARLRMLLPMMGPGAYNVLTPLTRQEEVMRFMGVQGGLEPSVRMALMRGLTRPGDIQRFVEDQVRTVQATQGQVTPQTMLQIMRMGGAAAAGWSPEFVNEALPALLLNLGSTGGRFNVGRGLEQLEQVMSQPGGLGGRGGMGGALNRRAFATALGRPISMADEQMMATDPARWARTVGAQIESQYGEQHIADVVRRLFTNPVVQQAMLFWMSTAGQASMQRFAQQRAAAAGSIQGADIMDRDPTVMLDQIGKRFQNLMTQIAKLNQPEYMRELKWVDDLIGALQRLAKQAGPEGVQIIIAGLGGLGGAILALAAIGGLAMLVPGGVITLAIAGIAAAITILVGLNWKAVETGLDTLWRAIRNFLINIGLWHEPGGTANMGITPQNRRGMAGIGAAFGDLWNQTPWGNQTFGYVNRNFPTADMFGARGQAIIPPQTFPNWLPSNIAPHAAARDKDVNVSVDLNLDGHTLGTVLMSRVLSNHEFPLGAPAANANSGWNGADYNWPSR